MIVASWELTLKHMCSSFVSENTRICCRASSTCVRTYIHVYVYMHPCVHASVCTYMYPRSSTSQLEELRLLPQTHPHLVGAYLEDIGPAILRPVATFRTDLAREAEVCGLPTTSLDMGEGAADVSSDVFESEAGDDPAADDMPASEASSVAEVVSLRWSTILLHSLEATST